MSVIQPSDFPDYAKDVISTALKRSGYPLAIGEHAGFDYEWNLRIGSPRHPVHSLSYAESLRKHQLHFLVTAAFRINRYWDVLSEERITAVPRGPPELPEELRDYVNELFPELDSSLLENLCRSFCVNIANQLASFPSQIRVERQIAEDLPDHYWAQRAYLMREIQDPIMNFAPPETTNPLALMHAKTTAMDLVLACETADILEMSYPTGPLPPRYEDLRQKLTDALHVESSSGIHGDRYVVNRWADVLEMRDWIAWKLIDEL